MSEFFAAVEAGGTKFRAAIVDPELTIVDEVRIATTTPDETLSAVEAFFAGQPKTLALGVASFGPLVVDRASADYGSIAATPKPDWTGAPLLSRLSAALGVPADIQTDVEAAAVVEQKLGAGKGLASVAYVTVGTGVGAAVSIDGVPFRGVDHTELGHIPVQRVEGDDYAGRCPFHGACLEGMAAGPAIGDRWNADPSTLGDRDEVWELEAAYLAQLVRVYSVSFVPDVVLFGGGVGTRPGMAELIQKAALADIAGYSVSHSSNANLVKAAAFGEDAGLVGAALLARSLVA